MDRGTKTYLIVCLAMGIIVGFALPSKPKSEALSDKIGNYEIAEVIPGNFLVTTSGNDPNRSIERWDHALRLELEISRGLEVESILPYFYNKNGRLQTIWVRVKKKED